MDYDLAIIGGGPAGLTAGICAVQMRLRTLIIEAEEAGGQPGTLYPEKEITNWPVFQTVTGREISKDFVDNATLKGCVLREHETAEDILDVPEGLEIVTDKGRYTAKAVIVAIGNGFLRPIKLDLPGMAGLEGRGVHYMMPSKDECRGKQIMFIGGGNSALEMALMVSTIADVCIVHRRDRFRADHMNIERVKDAHIRTVMGAEVLKVEGRGKVEKVLLKIGNEEREVPVDMIVVKVGMVPEPEHLRRWNLELVENGIRVDQQFRTSRKGVFACGDAIAYPGKFRQLVTSCSEGATAANSVVRYVRNR